MRKIFIALLFFSPALLYAQLGINIAVKAGVNFANLTNASEVKASSLTGYMIGGYISPKPKNYWGSVQKLYSPARVMIMPPAPIQER